MAIRNQAEDIQRAEEERIVVENSRYQLAKELANQPELWKTDFVPATAGSYNLNKPDPPIGQFTLKANVPSTIMLQGSSDLLFNAFTIEITAHSLQRNMAAEAWGTKSSDSEIVMGRSDSGSMVYNFPGLTAIDLVAARSSHEMKLQLSPRENGSFETGSLTLTSIVPTGKDFYAVKRVALRTDALRVENPSSGMSYLFGSVSLPSRVGIAIGDDSPVQIFPTEMADGGSVISRDLAGQLNAAWRKQAHPVVEDIRVPLKLTSMTDGLVTVSFQGSWGRSQPGKPVQVSLDAVNPALLTADWPFLGQSAAASVRLAGRLTGGIRQHLVPAAFQDDDVPFAVRAGEKLETAQAVVLAQGPTTANARQVSAIWLRLPALPSSEQQVELRLAKAVGSPPIPSDDPLVRVVAVLPADEAAYMKEDGGGYWFRAAIDTPFTLDGAQIVQPVFVMAAGRGEGTLLSHKRAAAQGQAGEEERIPTGVGEAGPALIRNLARSRSWEVQSFNRQRSNWILDLELVPFAEEYESAVSITVVHDPVQAIQAGLAGPAAAAAEIYWPSIAAPPGNKLAFMLQSAVKGSLTGQVVLYQSVKEL